jgi:hypothetical protein
LIFGNQWHNSFQAMIRSFLSYSMSRTLITISGTAMRAGSAGGTEALAME